MRLYSTQTASNRVSGPLSRVFPIYTTGYTQPGGFEPHLTNSVYSQLYYTAGTATDLNRASESVCVSKLHYRPPGTGHNLYALLRPKGICTHIVNRARFLSVLCPGCLRLT